MAPDLSEKLLGIDIDDADDGRRSDADGRDDEQEELEQFVFFALGDHRLALPVDAVRTLAEVPDGVTRVPRAPAAIEGMMDLRGEITAVIDPRVHFPEIEETSPSGRERLLVLDRPADQQSAAVRVDDVIGVETVPESDVHDEASVADAPLSGDSLEHPLVAALVEREREPRREVVASNRATAEVGGESDGEIAVGGGLAADALGDGADDVGRQFALDGEPGTEAETGAAVDGTDDAATGGAAPESEVVVEGTPVIDVEKLLLASGHRE